MLDSLPIAGDFSGKRVSRMLRSRLTRRLVIVGLSVAALVACCGVMSFVRTSSGSPSAPKRSAPPQVKLIWNTPASGLRSIAFAPGGRFLCTVGRDGAVSLYSYSGARIYRVHVDEATAAAVTGDGRFALVYSRMNPGNTSLTLLDAAGKACWDMDVVGAVWSADGSCTSGGARFAVGTGERYIYVLDVGPGRRHYRRWMTKGAVSSVVLATGAEDVVYATWQESTIGRCSVRGVRRWENKAKSASIHLIEPLGASDRMLVRVIPNRRDTNGTYSLIDRLGDTILRGTLATPVDANVLVSPNGQYICVGANELIRHGGRSMRERHALLMDASGRNLCEKGSPFFFANPLLVTSTGHVLLLDGGTQLFTMGPSGDLTPAAKAPAGLVRSVPSPDGSRVALVCRDGNMHILELSAGNEAMATPK